MSSLKLYGSTSGYVEIVPEATAGNNSVTLPNGSGSLVAADDSGNVNISGIVTATSFSGENVNISGIVTATSFSGDGSGLTGIAATENVRTNSLVVSGISTFSNNVNVGSAVTIYASAGIVSTTTVRASSVTASGGTTAARPADAVTGTIRYNSELGIIEYFDGTHWLAINAAGYRGIFAGGVIYPANTNTIEYITISSTGNSQDFGDLTVARSGMEAVSSSTRGVFGTLAPFQSPVANILDYITIATTGNAQDFGDGIYNLLEAGSASNETRGLWAGGYITNAIMYITIASTGNSVDFGDLNEAKWSLVGGPISSPTRGIFAGGSAFSPTKTNRIDYVTIATTGNSTNFGDLIVAMGGGAGGCSSSTRGLFAATGNIDYVTIASTGNSVDFSNGGIYGNNNAASSNNIRGLFAGGYASNNSIAYVTIATLGDAADFGDLTSGRYAQAGTSNGHGGLQ